METLVSLNREQGVTIIVVTHEADIAAYADRVITMRDGQILTDERVKKPERNRVCEATVPPLRRKWRFFTPAARRTMSARVRAPHWPSGS